MAIVYTTWNPSDKAPNIVLSGGNLIVTAGTTGYESFRSILGVTEGKWYWEVEVNAKGIHGNIHIGIGNSNANLIVNHMAQTSDGYSYFASTGYKWNGTTTAFGAVYGVNDIISVALDMDAGKLWWAKNGAWQDSGDPGAGTNEAFSGISGMFYAMCTLYNEDDQITANFGDSSFVHDVPSGFNSGLYTGSLIVYYVSGYVIEAAVSVNRQIYAHNRDTGELVGSTTSSGAGGYFYCETTYSGSHYVVCLDDTAGLDYNDLIYGNILPATTSG